MMRAAQALAKVSARANLDSSKIILHESQSKAFYLSLIIATRSTFI